MIEFDFRGRVALVTGGTSGIGRAVAAAFARAGASVVVAGRTEESGEAVAASLSSASAPVVFVEADVRDETSVARLVERTIARFGRLDHACNAAGVGGDFAPLETASQAVWDDVIATNARGVYLATRYEALAMVAGGTIVNLASIYGEVGRAAHHGYVASKHAVVGLTKSIALELAPRGVRVNAIGAGVTRTDAMVAAESFAPEMVRALVAEHPMRRMATDSEIATAVLFLSAEEAGFVTGTSLSVDGGYLAA